MGKFDERAKGIFARYSGKDTLYFTSDGQAFFEDNAAGNHAEGLADKKTVSVDRSDVLPVSPTVSHDDDDASADKAKADKAAADKAKADQAKADKAAADKAKADQAKADKAAADKAKADAASGQSGTAV